MASTNQVHNRRRAEAARPIMPTNGTPVTPILPSAPMYVRKPKVEQQSPKQKAERERARKERTTVRTKNKSKEYHVHVNTGRGGTEQTAAQRTGIGDLEPSAGSLRAFCERGRKVLREAANDLAYGEELLRKALREVPPPPGQGRSGSWARANRVARSLKRAANASQAASAHCARTWMAYTREYEQELATFGGPRMRPRSKMDFGS